MNDNEIKDLLKKAKVIAVVGISADPSRASYGVSKFLIEAGYEIYGINPSLKQVHDRHCYPTLLDVPKKIDIVDVFRKPEAVPEIVNECIKIKAQAVWLQEGVHHAEAEDFAKKNGLLVVSDKCILKLHKKLI